MTGLSFFASPDTIAECSPEELEQIRRAVPVLDRMKEVARRQQEHEEADHFGQASRHLKQALGVD